MRLKLAYFGTPYFSADFLERLITDTTINQLIEVKLVVTQPDKPAGRKQILTPSPVKIIANKYGVEIYDANSSQQNFRGSQLFEQVSAEATPRIPRMNEARTVPTNVGMRVDLPRKFLLTDKLKQANIDIALLYAYGQIIPKDLLTVPKYGFLNIHPSLLPKYRGPSPIAYPLILGSSKTGVTIIKMDEQIDHGPIIAQEELAISPTDRRPDLEKKLTNLAFEMFKRLIAGMAGVLGGRVPPARKSVKVANQRTVNKQNSVLSTNQNIPKSINEHWREGNLGQDPLKPPTKQNHYLATYTRLLKKSDGFIPLPILKKAINNQPLTFDELPLILKKFGNWKLEIGNSSKIIYDYFRGMYPWPGIWTLIDIKKATEPPRFYKKTTSDNLGGLMKKRLKITDMDFINGKLLIKSVQLEGKKEVDFKTFNTAYKIF